MLTVFYDCYTVLSKVYSEGAYLKQALTETPVEEKNRPLISKTCYGVLDNDAALSYFLSRLSAKILVYSSFA